MILAALVELDASGEQPGHPPADLSELAAHPPEPVQAPRQLARRRRTAAWRRSDRRRPATHRAHRRAGPSARPGPCRSTALGGVGERGIEPGVPFLQSRPDRRARASCSRPYSRTVASIVNQARSPRSCSRTRLPSTSAASASTTSTSRPRPSTRPRRGRTPRGTRRAAAAAPVPPDAESCALHSMVARSVRWRSGRSRSPLASMRQGMVEPLHERGRREHAQAGGREFERERRVVEGSRRSR